MRDSESAGPNEYIRLGKINPVNQAQCQYVGEPRKGQCLKTSKDTEGAISSWSFELVSKLLLHTFGHGDHVDSNTTASSIERVKAGRS